MCRWSSGRGPPSEVVAEGLFVGNSGRDALARATTGQRTPTGDRPTKPRRTKQCTEGVRRRLSTVVYGGQQSLVHGGVQQVYSREYTEVQQCTAGSTRQCTAGLSVLVGVRQVSRYWSVYGRCTAGCTDGACSLVRCPLRLVYILYLLRRLVSGWCLLAWTSSPWPQRARVSLVPMPTNSPSATASGVSEFWQNSETVPARLLCTAGLYWGLVLYLTWRSGTVPRTLVRGVPDLVYDSVLDVDQVYRTSSTTRSYILSYI